MPPALLESTTALARGWVDLATLMSASMEADAIPDYCAIGNRVAPMMLATVTLFERIGPMVDAVAFQSARDDLESVRLWLADWPVTDLEHVRRVRDEIARGEVFPVGELFTSPPGT